MSTVLNAGILGFSILWWLNSSGDGRGIYFLLVFDFWCWKSRSILSVELLDAQWSYVVDFSFKQRKAACNFISFLCFIKTARFNKKRLQKEDNQKPQKMQGKESKSWSNEFRSRIGGRKEIVWQIFNNYF